MKNKILYVLLMLFLFAQLQVSNEVQANPLDNTLLRDAKFVESTNYYGYVVTNLGKVYEVYNKNTMDITHKFGLVEGDTIIGISTMQNRVIAFSDYGRVYEWLEGENPHEISKMFTIDSDDKIIDIDAGIQHAIVLTEKGRVYVWGKNNDESLGVVTGQLGLGEFESNPAYLYEITGQFDLSPVDPTTGEMDQVVQVEAASYFTGVITKFGRLYVWGLGHQGEIGNDKATFLSINVENLPNDITWRCDITDGDRINYIHMGRQHTILTTSNGRIIGFGQNWEGQLGNSMERLDYPGFDQTPIPPNTHMANRVPTEQTAAMNLEVGDYISQVASISDTTVALSAKGNVYVFGQGYTVDPLRIEHHFGLMDSEVVDYVSKGLNYVLVKTNMGRVIQLDTGSTTAVEISTPINDINIVSFEYETGTVINGDLSSNAVLIDFGMNMDNFVQQVSINGDLYNDISYEDSKVKVMVDNSEYTIDELINVQLNYIRFRSGEVGNYTTVSTSATLVDDQFAPKVLSDFDELFIEIGQGNDLLLDVVVVDDLDGVIEYTVSGTVDWNQIGDYDVTYTAMDAHNNTTNVTKTIHVLSEDAGETSLNLNGNIVIDGFSDDIYELVDFNVPTVYADGEKVYGYYDDYLTEMYVTGDYNLQAYSVPYTYLVDGKKIVINREITFLTKGVSTRENWDIVTPEFLGTGTINGTPFTSGDSITEKGTYELEVNYEGFVYTTEFVVSLHLQSVEINSDDITMSVGERLDLSVIFFPANAKNKDIEWDTSNEIVASVDYGEVFARKAGTTTITVTSFDGGFTDSITITVTQEVLFVEILDEDQEVTVFDEMDLDILVFPTDSTVQDVTWDTSNSDIATVDEFGHVVTHDIGEVVITLTSVDGGYTDTITLTVTDVSPTIILNPSAGSIVVGEEYVDNGCLADLMGEIKECFLEESQIDNTTEGTYDIVYYAYTLSGKKAYIVRKVKVLPEEPVITIVLNPGVDTVELYGTWEDTGCSVMGVEGYECSKVRGFVDVNLTGTYEIVYVAQVDGVQYLYKRYVTVYDPNTGFQDTNTYALPQKRFLWEELV